MGEFLEKWWPTVLGVVLLGLAAFFVWPSGSGQPIAAETGQPLPAVGQSPGEKARPSDADIDRQKELLDARRRAELRTAESLRNGQATAASTSESNPMAVGDPVRPVKLTQDSPEVRRALRLVEVELYETSWCQYCKKTRAFLERSGVGFRAYDIETDETAKLRRDRLAPGSGVPLTVVDGEAVRGFSEPALNAAFQNAIERRLAARR